MLGSSDGRDVMSQTLQSRSQLFSWFAENPPIIPVGSSTVMVSFLLHAFIYPLIHLRKSVKHVLCSEARKVDHHYAARCMQKVTSVLVEPDVFVQSGNLPK